MKLAEALLLRKELNLKVNQLHPIKIQGASNLSLLLFTRGSNPRNTNTKSGLPFNKSSRCCRARPQRRNKDIHRQVEKRNICQQKSIIHMPAQGAKTAAIDIEAS